MSGEDASVVPELKLRIADEIDAGRIYLKLPQCDGLESPLAVRLEAADGMVVFVEPCTPRMIRCRAVYKWVKLGFLAVLLGFLAAVFFKWVGPFLMEKEIMPIINWETTTFSVPVLAVILFFTVALFPTILLPSTPSMWVAGMTFGYGYGFLLIMSAVAIGLSLPYFIGHLFYHKIQGWLERYPKKASVIRLAGEGDWMNQFQAVVLIRVSPFPYILYNYCAVATNVKYGPYFCGSMLGIAPEVFVAIYTGILIRTLADASHEHRFLSTQQIIFDIIGFIATVTTAVICTHLAKKRLKRIQMEEDMLLR
ncbi:hypothetical protein V2J09_003113 [Rumex salicifolius]